MAKDTGGKPLGNRPNRPHSKSGWGGSPREPDNRGGKCPPDGGKDGKHLGGRGKGCK